MEKLSRSLRNLFTASLFALALAPVAGCGGETVSVSGAGEAFNHSGQLLSIGDVLEINGTYGAGCLTRTGGWSVATTMLSSTTNPALDVVRANSDCTLTVNALRIGSTEASAQTYTADVPFQLGNSFRATGASFRLSPSQPVALYANARVLPDMSFSNDFMIEMIYSADAGAVSANVGAAYEVVTSTAVATGVLAPDYGIDATGINLQVDANSMVTAASGAVVLQDMNQLGETYVISATDFGVAPVYGDVDLAYTNGSAQPISGPNPMIAAAAFNLTGANLVTPLPRSIIIAHEDSGVFSYQVIAIRFLGP